MTGLISWIDDEKPYRRKFVDEHVERLFTYGTLQFKHVQQSVWGEVMDEGGEEATLKGYSRVSLIAIKPDEAGEVEGVIYCLTPAQLRATDAYEGSGYRRLRCLFPDRETAWVYVPRASLMHLLEDYKLEETILNKRED